jgi:hypothetical protein
MKAPTYLFVHRRAWLTAAAAGMLLLGGATLFIQAQRAHQPLTLQFGVIAFMVLTAGVGGGLLVRLQNSGPMTAKLDALAGRSDRIAAHAAQVARDAGALATVTSREAAGIEQIASTVEELASMTQRNADNTQETDHLMQETRATVTQADASMRSLLAAIQAIQQQSTATSKIIKTIDEIAFQTNILALNAAIEAARAGEHGASFGVVAEEVRTLARHAADAARETAVLLQETNGHVGQAAAVVEETNRQFSDVNGRVVKSSGLVSQIAQASNEQARGLDQLNAAIVEIEKVIQHTVANADHSAEAANRMTHESQAVDVLLGELRGILGVRRGESRTQAVNDQRPVLRIAVSSLVADAFGKWTQQVPVARIERFDSPFANRPTVDLILQLQALAAGGLDCDYELSVQPNHGRAVIEVQQGYTDLTAETVWDSEIARNAEALLSSRQVIQNGEFEKGLYALPGNARLLAATLPDDLNQFVGATVFNWPVDLQLLESLGLKRLEKASKVENVFQLIREGRADFTLLEFASTADMGVENGGVKLVPVPHYKIGLPGGRSWIVSKQSPHASVLVPALDRGIAALRKEGRIERAFRESGFLNAKVARWKRLSELRETALR